MSDTQLKNQILEVLSKNMNGGYLNNVGGAMSGGAMTGGLLKKDLKKEVLKFPMRILKQIVKDYKALHNYSYANKSKEELTEIIFEVLTMKHIQQLIKQHKKPNKPKKSNARKKINISYFDDDDDELEGYSFLDKDEKIGGKLKSSLRKDVLKLEKKTLKEVVKAYKEHHNYSYANKSKEELVDIIFEVLSMKHIQQLIKQYGKPKKQLTEAQKNVLRERLKKARAAKKNKAPKKKAQQRVDDKEQLKKLKKEALQDILSGNGIKYKSSDNKAQLIDLILERQDVFGGNFFDVLKSIGSTVLDVGKTVAPFVPLIL